MEKAYKFRLYPTKEQEELIQKTFGCCRFVYNYYLSKKDELYYGDNKTMNFFECSRDLAELKKTLGWLNDVDSSALLCSLRDLDLAFKNFFRKRENKENCHYPKFKSKHNHYQSYRSRSNIKVAGDSVRLPKLGFVNCRVSRVVKGRILNATVSQSKSGKYYVSICCTDVEFEPLPKTGAVCGVDLGIKDLAITSDGVKYPNPRYLYNAEEKIVKLSRELSRKSKDSKRREKARIKLARQYEKVVNQRRDYLQKLTTELIRNYDVICIEDLATNNMMKNHHLAKAVSDVSFSEIRRELEYKAEWYGKQVVVISRFYPSSQTCSTCGAKWSGTKDLKLRGWTCPECGTQHDRDVNAAKNILNEGLRLLT